MKNIVKKYNKKKYKPLLLKGFFSLLIIIGLFITLFLLPQQTQNKSYANNFYVICPQYYGLPCPASTPTTPPGTCEDGIDNNGNGLIDAADPACHTDGNVNNIYSYTPTGSEGTNSQVTGGTATTTYTGGVACGYDQNQDPLYCPVGYNCINQPNAQCAPNNISTTTSGCTLASCPPTVGQVSSASPGSTYCGQSYTNGAITTSEYCPAGYACTAGSCTLNSSSGSGVSTCADGIDNNGNGLIDSADPACHTDGNASNASSYNPNGSEGTTTTSGSNTPLTIEAILHGIGNGGDNANPSGNSLSNKNPLHPTLNATVQIYNSTSQLFSTATGSITYASASGSYTGTLTADKNIPAGNYSVKVTVDRHLTKLAANIQAFPGGSTTVTIPTATLVAGDINSDNNLNILDYNMLLDCYSDLSAAPNCSDPQKKVNTDLNDDGQINSTDYNLFLRELSVQNGD